MSSVVSFRMVFTSPSHPVHDRPLSDRWVLCETPSIELGRAESTETESEEATGAFTPPYDEATAARICRVLLRHGASPNGNAMYEMRPLHVAIRREWMEVSRLLLDAGMCERCRRWPRRRCFDAQGPIPIFLSEICMLRVRWISRWSMTIRRRLR